MKLTPFAILAITTCLANAASANPAVLANGFRLTPAGTFIPLAGDMPVKMLLSSDGSKLFVETAGFHDHGVYVIDTRARRLSESVPLLKLWPGMALSADGRTLYAAGGQVYDPAMWQGAFGNLDSPPALAPCFKRSLVAMPWDGSKLGAPADIAVAGWDDSKHFAAGMATCADGSAYMLDQDHDQVVKLDGNPLAVTQIVPVGYRPYAVVVSPDRKSLAVSNWGDSSVSLIDAVGFYETARIHVGSHPSELAYGPDGRLFVACAGDNRVCVIRRGQLMEQIDTALTPVAPVGSTPDALAVSADGTRLYVANADNNDIAVIDISHPESRVLGFIPTGWYPSAIAVSRTGKTLYVGIGKGMSGMGPNFPARMSPDRRDTTAGVTEHDYIANLLQGSVSVVNVPTSGQLVADTRQVLRNTPYTNHPQRVSTAGLNVLTSGKIKHVLFIIRENRTYDQVFGDIGKGNSDPSICIFGKKVTPNAHALANRYVLFDNLYCDGEVSEDGHQWCDAAYATDFTEKAWINGYSDRHEPEADERLTASPAGYLWDNCRRHHVSYFSYGEMATFQASPHAPPQFTGEADLDGHCSPEFQLVRFGEQHDTARVAVFARDLQRAEKTGVWPSFAVMWLGEDHTQGLQAGTFTPYAMVGANDLALGQVVEAVSHSRFWKDTAILVIEDDAQDGPDHVDAHRTEGLFISPYVKRGAIDSTHYTTTSFVRTMELALGLPPMTQFDAGATPLTASITAKPDTTAYSAIRPLVDLSARNPEDTPGARQSAMLDLSAPDKADPDALNRILWAALRPGQSMPAPVRRFSY